MTAQSEDDPPRPSGMAVVDTPLSPEVFADLAAGFFFRNGVVSITFTSARVDHTTTPGPVSHVVVTRLTMPADGAQGLAVGLFNFLAEHGLAPKIDPKKAN